MRESVLKMTKCLNYLENGKCYKNKDDKNNF